MVAQLGNTQEAKRKHARTTTEGNLPMKHPRTTPAKIALATATAALLLSGCQGLTDEGFALPEASELGIELNDAQPGDTLPDGQDAATTTDEATGADAPDNTQAGAAPAGSAADGTALGTVSTLAVKGRAPKTGYDRDLFGSAWTDDTNAALGHDGCDTRNNILSRDLDHAEFKADTNGCVVLFAVLDDPYTGTEIHFERGRGTSNDVQIDHVVALSDAWQKGAQGWDETTRATFANDPLNLIAADGPINAQKGDGDTATWLPPNKPYRCAYVARQVAVKHKYGLWVTEAEHEAMTRVLSDCPDYPLPTDADALLDAGDPVSPVR